MVVINKYHCRLGNQLFQYVFARLLAEHFGYALSVPPLLGLPNEINGKRVLTPTEVLSESGDRNTIPVDAMSVFDNRSPRRIVLDGLFQQASIYEPHRDKIREWFSNSLSPVESANMVAHLRFGDYEALGWSLPKNYYAEVSKRAAEEFGISKGTIVTDDVEKAVQYIDVMKALKIEILKSDVITDLRRIVGAKYVACSNSSFSWWGAFLSNAEKIWMPHNWQPWGKSQPGDHLLVRGRLYPTDLRMKSPEWSVIDMDGATK